MIFILEDEIFSFLLIFNMRQNDIALFRVWIIFIARDFVLNHILFSFYSFISTMRHLNNLLVPPHLECLYELKSCEGYFYIFPKWELNNSQLYCGRLNKHIFWALFLSFHSTFFSQHQVRSATKWQQWHCYCEVVSIALLSSFYCPLRKHETVIY